MSVKAFRISGPRYWAQDPTTKGPLAFGKLYTYEPGTTTPKLTYTDESGETSNANPVVLNAAGYASVHMKGAYKFVQCDANDVVIWSADLVSQPVTLGDIDVMSLTPGSMIYWDGEMFVSGDVAVIRELIGSDNPAVVSLASIATTPNTLPYVAAADTFAVLQFLPFVQDIIKADDITAFRAAIGPRLGQLEGLTLVEGDILYVTAAGALAKLTKGAAQTVLRQNAALTAPEWVQPMRKLLTSGNVAAPVANLAIALASYVALGYSQFELELDDIAPVTDSVDLRLVISTDGGANYLSTAYQYAVTRGSQDSDRQTNAAQFRLAYAAGNNSEFGNHNIRFDISAARFWYMNDGVHMTTDGTVNQFMGGGFHRTGNVKQVRLQFSSGNIASIVGYRLYGLKKTA
jgi:hypothetical protein